MSFPILGTNTLSSGFEVANSCRFNDDDSPKMEKDWASGNTDRWTWSCWVKRCELGANNGLFAGAYDSDNRTDIKFDSSDRFRIESVTGNSNTCNYVSTRVFRDVGAWYHFVVVWDTADGTAGDRIKLYVNGVEENTWTTESNPAQNLDSWMNTTSNSASARVGLCDGNYFDGYMAEMVFIDGSALAPTSFGEFDEDSPTIWKPIDVSGLTFGTNGFYLDFEDSSNLGNDANGGTDLTETNLAAADSATDTPTNNFCTFNVINPTFTGTNTQGNCKHLSSSSAWRAIYGTIPFTTGKWYAEFKMVADGSSAGPGVINIDDGGDTFRLGETNRGLGQGENAVAYLSNAQILDGGNTIKTGQTTWTDNDILGVAIDATNGFVYWHKNGTYLDGATSGTTVGVPTSGGSGTGGYPLADLVAANGTYLFGVGGDDAWNVEANFGGCSAFTVSSANQDGTRYGNFEYAVPSGYLALCTKNLGSDGG